MSDVPMKWYWRGKDVDTLSIEELREAVKYAFQAAQDAQKRTMDVHDMHRRLREARR